MDDQMLLEHFEEQLKTDPKMSPAVAAMKTLIKLLETGQAQTLQECLDKLKNGAETLSQTEKSVSSISSGTELFIRYITLDVAETLESERFDEQMLSRGRAYVTRAVEARDKIARLGHSFITDGMTILTHSCSQVVLQTLEEAAEDRRFTVYVTESQPDASGLEMQRELKALGIPTTLILDAAVGYIMEKVDMVLVGAESVLESGGIINKIGCFGMSVCAKAMNKPFYAAAESFKFRRLYPLNQQDIPKEFKYPAHTLASASEEDLTATHPRVDYTPPSYINLMFSDLGILTPSAVSDELIQQYI